MRILLTGVSSFTGCWFAEALAHAGASVLATTRSPLDSYAPPEQRRLEKARAAGVELVPGAAFGDARFLSIVRAEGPFDLLGHHGAEVGDFRRSDYDPLSALEANARGAVSVAEELAGSGAAGLVVTASIFEPDEGAGSDRRTAFNAYGLAKQLTWQTLRYHAERTGLAIGRFVVPHPFGPLEKPGFTSQLARAWLADRPADVRRPQLVRDFIHVDLLAAAYAAFCRDLRCHRGSRRLGPSGYVGSLAALARLIAAELQPRLGRPCEVRVADPPEAADEPLYRCNSDTLEQLVSGWPYARSWDRLAEFYLQLI
jgi:nucleoside-diphosphate-sugar epimerase